MSAAFDTYEEVLGGPGLGKRDAQLAQALIDDIRRECGHLLSKDLHTEMIERSRPADSPTHHLFEWDPNKAHETYLYERARQIVMKINVIFSLNPRDPKAKTVKVRAYPTVTWKGKKGPAPMAEVVRTPEMISSVVEEALADLERWRHRYEQLARLKKLGPVFAAIKKVLKK